MFYRLKMVMFNSYLKLPEGTPGVYYGGRFFRGKGMKIRTPPDSTPSPGLLLSDHADLFQQIGVDTSSGWWFQPTPLKNMKVSWDDDIPNIWKIIKFMFQTTNQSWSEIQPPWVVPRPPRRFFWGPSPIWVLARAANCRFFNMEWTSYIEWAGSVIIQFNSDFNHAQPHSVTNMLYPIINNYIHINILYKHNLQKYANICISIYYNICITLYIMFV